MSIDFANESPVDLDEVALVAVARYALHRMDVHPGAELTLVAVDLETIADLHVRWMDLEGPTDVMSFPMDELTPGARPDAPDVGPAMLGDIVLCPEFAADQAETAGHSLEHELNVLTVHGVLHLLGFDHAEPEEEREMFALQERIVADFYTEQRQAAAAKDRRERDEKILGRGDLLDADFGQDREPPR